MKKIDLNISIDLGFEKIISEKIENADWGKIQFALSLLKSPNSGSIKLKLAFRSLAGPSELQVFAEKNAFYLMLGENVEVDGEVDFNVRTYYNSKAGNKKIEIGGYEWPEVQICYEFDVVLNLCSEFCQTGDIADVRMS